MVHLLTPPDVAEANAAMDRQSIHDIAEAARLTEELQRIDAGLSIAWVPPEATEFDHPGRWHVRKRVPGSYDEWWPLLTETGGYKEPGPWLFDTLTANDMWNPRVHRSKKEARAKHREAKVRSKARHVEQRQDEMALGNRAARRIKGDGGMTKRTDLLVPAVIAEERRAKKAQERAEEAAE